MKKIQTLNKISPVGLDNFPRDEYELASEFQNPDAILVRSADMSEMNLGDNVKAIARAGAGVNNIPVAKMTEKGIVVFNTPGANANAVKELVIASLLIASRPVISANSWAKTLSGKGSEIPSLAEKGKSQFVGPEIAGKTLGVVGLGAIGAMVANTAINLGMNVIGFDPFISIDAAWSLSRDVKKADSLETLLSKSDYLTIHTPQTSDTKDFINADRIATMKTGIRILNFARAGLIVTKDMIDALNSGKIACFVSDFTDEELLKNEKVICLPHLGASTPEAEDNCAIMAVKELREFLESGNIFNSVNFPNCALSSEIPQTGTRICITNKNVPNMVGQITTVLAEAQLNISAMVNQNRADIAYTMIDVEDIVADTIAKNLCNIPIPRLQKELERLQDADTIAKNLCNIPGVINLRLISGKT